MATDQEYTNFKKVLEYFVAHLEYCVNEDQNGRGYDDYIKPLVVKNLFYKTGQGYKRDGIQNAISEWNTYDVGKIAINVSPNYGKYYTKTCYLNWISKNLSKDFSTGFSTGLNVNVKSNDGKYVSTLTLGRYDPVGGGRDNDVKHCSLLELGLFNHLHPNQKLMEFLDSYMTMMKDYIEIKKKETLLSYMTLIEASKNLILTGAPGTGKTYLANEIAKAFVSEKPEDNASEKLENNNIDFVQFHPSYDYTDFVEGLRPVKLGNGSSSLGFERKDGTFKAFCKKALESPNEKFVFIIDEINRGDIAKIFGELFFAIDPGYRGERGRVKTQYSNLMEDGDIFKDGFYVPKNVYIIGTMNDIDRNVESMDFAIRRRFVWKEIKPEDTIEMLGELEKNVREQAEARMRSINKEIKATDGLGSAYQLGASYFLKLKDYKGDFQKLWELHIAPLLNEYLRGMPKASEDFKKLQDAWNKGIQLSDDANNSSSQPVEADNAAEAE